MGFEFEANGRKTPAEDVSKKDQGIGKKDEAELAEGLELLRMIKKRKGEQLSPFMQGMLEKSGGVSGGGSKDFKEAVADLESLGDKKAKGPEEEGEEGEQTKACQKCGAENPYSANFCGYCGNKFEEIKKEEDQEGEKTKICPNCGAEGNISDKFCGNCGNKFEAMGTDKNEKSISANYTPQEALRILNEKNRSGERNISEKLSGIEDRSSLHEYLKSIDGIKGSEKFFSSEDLSKIVDEVLDSGIDPLNKKEFFPLLTKVTRSEGLRDCVNKIAIMEKIKKI